MVTHRVTYDDYLVLLNKKFFSRLDGHASIYVGQASNWTVAVVEKNYVWIPFYRIS